MTTLTHRSPVISLAAERARRGETEIFPAAHIESGPALDRALSSLGLVRVMPKPRRRRASLATALVASLLAWALLVLGLAAILTGAVDFALRELSRFAPGALR
jgi:hypothetical protein